MSDYIQQEAMEYNGLSLNPNPRSTMLKNNRDYQMSLENCSMIDHLPGHVQNRLPLCSNINVLGDTFQSDTVHHSQCSGRHGLTQWGQGLLCPFDEEGIIDDG